MSQDTIFANETAPQLKDALHKEATAAQGYLDILRLSINRRAQAGEPTKSFDGESHSLNDGRVRIYPRICGYRLTIICAVAFAGVGRYRADIHEW